MATRVGHRHETERQIHGYDCADDLAYESGRRAGRQRELFAVSWW
jgi:hypothetical protein